MATYNTSLGGGGGGGGIGTTAAAAAHHQHSNSTAATAGGPGSQQHALPLAGASIHGNGAVGMDVFEQELNFDEALLDSVNGLAPLPFTPSYEFDGFNTFEDPFSYSARATSVYDLSGAGGPHGHGGPHAAGAAGLDGEPFNEGESPSQELDNKLLGFSAPLLKAQLVDGAGNFAETNMSAELYGMFFVAEDVFGGENTGRPLELTCYRRNLWQCSGQITLPRHLSHMIDEHGQQVPIIELAASITAMESIEGKPTEIISIPWKSSSAAAANSNNGNIVNDDNMTKSPTAPARAALDLSTGQELDHHRVSLPVSWKRLQFKHATANNGRRKGLQQHYVVQINLLTKMKTGEWTKIAEIQSGPVIVRGRSPRNFDSRKDVPLSAGGSSTGNGGSDKKPSERRSTTTPSTDIPMTPGGSSGGGFNLKTEKGTDLAQNIQKYHSLGNVQQSGDWATPSSSSPYSSSSQHQSKKIAVSPNMSRPPVPAWSSAGSSTSFDNNNRNSNSSISAPTPATPRSNSSTRQQSQHNSTTTTTLPINLSLSEDERSPNRSNTDSVSPRFPKASHVLGGGSSSGKNSSGNTTMGGSQLGGNAEDDEEQLYEYFPLTVDDWMPPVDAIYRPHVVHHTIVPPELKAQQVRSRTKRYFSSD